MKEVWKVIPDEENYEVSTSGRVRNRSTHNIKSQRLDRNGYSRVTLYPSGKTYSIHRLVMLTFNPEDNFENAQVDHLDGVKTNNKISNLEWVTPKENTIRLHKAGRAADVNGSRNCMASIDEDTAKKIKYDFTHTISELAKIYNTSVGIVETIRRRERWNTVIDAELEDKFLSGELKYVFKSPRLSKEIKDDIIKDLNSGGYTVRDLASKYNVHNTTIYRIKNRVNFND